jgi:hypothetical protein
MFQTKIGHFQATDIELTKVVCTILLDGTNNVNLDFTIKPIVYRPVHILHAAILSVLRFHSCFGLVVD